MFIKSFVTTGFLAVAFGVFAAACGSADTTTADGSQSLTTDQNPDLFSCETDSDCVAVEKISDPCCPGIGWKIAVNTNEVDAYRDSKVCESRHLCPMLKIYDPRVAQCNFETKKCEMVDPTSIRCGGFVASAHSCPDGYQCKFTQVPDLPGNCVKTSN